MTRDAVVELLFEPVELVAYVQLHLPKDFNRETLTSPIWVFVPHLTASGSSNENGGRKACISLFKWGVKRICSLQ